jgi:hypothetical protein
VNERFDSLFFVEFLKHRVSVAQVREHFICLLTAAAMTWDDFPNLRRRPPTPSKGRGPVQVRIRRAFIARGAEVLSSSEIYSWSHVRRRLSRCKSMPAGIYNRTTRTLRVMCEPVGRGSGRGRPILWRLRNTEGAKTSPVLPGEDKTPCLPTKAPQPPTGGAWLHEIKHDGFRVVARKDGERVRLYSRPGNDVTWR